MSEAQFDKTEVLGRPPSAAAPSGAPGVLRCVNLSVLNSPVGIEIKLESGEVTIGRGSDNVVILDSDGVSRKHARVFLADGVWQVEDLGSTNGTRVNNSRIARCALADGDTVAFARACYKFHVVKPKAAARSLMDLDLGAASQTVALHPARGGRKPEVAPADAAPPPAPPHPRAAEPGAEQVYDTGSRRRVAAAPPQPDPRRRGATLAVAAVALLALAAGAAYFFGLV